MNRNLLIGMSLVGIPSMAFAAGPAKENSVQSKRNVLVIICDQLRADFLNPYGGEMIKTPGFNELASMGVVFDNAITASPVSGPARASMMTGLYPSGHGVWANDHPWGNDIKEFFPQRMADNGYITAAFGKLHHTPCWDAKGFKIYIPFEENRMNEREPYMIAMKMKHPELKDVKNFSRLNKNMRFMYPMTEHYDYWITSNTINFLDDYKVNKSKDYEDKPFFVWMSLQGPHGPYDPPKELDGTVQEDKIPDVIKVDHKGQSSVVKERSIWLKTKKDYELMKKKRAAYAQKVKLEDMQLERVLQKLKENKQLENTTIIFVADHGDQIGDHDLNQKGPFPYPYHQNIPLILANCPGVERGVHSDLLVGNIDVPSTVISLAGDNHPLGLSRSLVSQLHDKKMQREVNFSEFADSYKMVEDKQYRMAYFPFEGNIMLFDKKNDPKYQHNLGTDPKYSELRMKFMKDLMDFQILSKGVHFEAQDITQPVQDELNKKDPNWLENYEIYFPLTYGKMNLLKKNGLDYHYNDVLIPHKVTRAYGLFWKDPRWIEENKK